MELLLIRHGETWSNVTGALDTADPGADLTPLGEQQARALAVRLAADGVRVDAVLCSPRTRTRRTAEPLARANGLVPACREGLAELSAGDWEMSTAEEHRRGYGEVVRAWMSGDHEPTVPGGEPLAQAVARFDSVLAEVLDATPGVTRVAVVAHGAIIRTWCAVRASGLPDLDTLGSSLANTAVVRLRAVRPGADGRSWRVVEWAGQVMVEG